MNARANFVRMQDSTREDWQTIGGEFMQFAGGLPQRVVKHLQTSATRLAPSTTQTSLPPSSSPS
jgi:hypothetical protein